MLDIRRGQNVEKCKLWFGTQRFLFFTLYILPVVANVWLMVGVESVILAEDDGSG